MAKLFAKQPASGKLLYSTIWTLWLLIDDLQEKITNEPEAAFLAHLENSITDSLRALQHAGFKIES